MTKTKTRPEETVTAIAGVLHIKPCDDRKVRKPDGSALPQEGEAVNVDGHENYWLRRANDGDVEINTISDGEAA